MWILIEQRWGDEDSMLRTFSEHFLQRQDEVFGLRAGWNATAAALRLGARATYYVGETYMPWSPY